MEATAPAPDVVSEKPERVVTLGGRTFRQSVVTTIDRDAYLSKRFRVSGLATFARTFNPERDELTEFSERLLWEAFDSGVLYEILGGMLVEDSVRWTRHIAATNAAFFENITDATDKQRICDLAGDVLFDFLVLAAASRRIFPNSSEPSGQHPSDQRPENRPEPADAVPVTASLMDR